MIQKEPAKFAQKISACDIEFDSQESFTELLTRHINTKGVKIGDLVVKTNLSRPYIYNLLSGDRKPGRNIVLRVSLALELNLDETQNLLKSADKPLLSPKVRRDAGIICCLLQGFNLAETYDYLQSIGEEPLV